MNLLGSKHNRAKGEKPAFHFATISAVYKCPLVPEAPWATRIERSDTSDTGYCTISVVYTNFAEANQNDRVQSSAQIV